MYEANISNSVCNLLYDCCMSIRYLNKFGIISLATLSSVHVYVSLNMYVSKLSMAFIFLFFYVGTGNVLICAYMHVYGHVYTYKCVYTCVSMYMRVCMCTYTVRTLCVYTHLRDKAQLGVCVLEHAHYCGELQFRKWKNNKHEHAPKTVQIKALE